MVRINFKSPSEDMMRLAMPSDKAGRFSVGMEKSVGEYFFISLDKLIPFKKQARRHFDKKELDELALSIIECGVRQPLTVVRSPEDGDKYEIVSGERRAKAAKLAGLNSVPCIILSDYAKAETIAVIENIHRSDLHPVELAKAYRSLLDNGNFSSGEEVANSLGINKSSFYETMQILELPEIVQQALIDNGIKSREKMRRLLKSSDPEDTLEKMLHSRSGSSRYRSVIKVGIKGGHPLLQQKNIDNLDDNEKSALKNLLLDIASSL